MKATKIPDGLVGRPIRLNRQRLELQKGKNFSEVMFIGDVHLGSPQCDVERFKLNVAYCLSHHYYVLLMGDLTETATRHSVGAGVYEQTENAERQHEEVADILRPLAEANLIIGTLRGNHGERVYKETGFDMDKALARELHIPFLGDACWNQLKVGSETYNVYTLHGRTGSRFDGTALLAVERISTSFFCDLLCHGHSHKCINSIVVMQRVVNGTVREHKKHLVVTGHYVKYDRGLVTTVAPVYKQNQAICWNNPRGEVRKD